MRTTLKSALFLALALFGFLALSGFIQHDNRDDFAFPLETPPLEPEQEAAEE